jgi:hypothetical protein
MAYERILVWASSITLFCHIDANDMTNVTCDYKRLRRIYRRRIVGCVHRVAWAAESTDCVIYVHAPIDSLNNASHDAAPHLAAPFIADRTNASIAANANV